MTQRSVLILLVLIALSFSVGCFGTTQTDGDNDEVLLLYTKGVSIMYTLLYTEQIDGFIAWEPYGTIADEGKLGKTIVLTQDLPPQDVWGNHPCCVVVMHDDLIRDKPELARAFCVLMHNAIAYTNENPEKGADTASNWILGNKSFTFGSYVVSSEAAMQRSADNLIFSDEITAQWLSSIGEIGSFEMHQLNSDRAMPDGDISDQVLAMVVDTSFSKQAIKDCEGETVCTPPKSDAPLRVGYLMTNHDTPLFLSVKDWEYFNRTYGVCIRPPEPVTGSCGEGVFIVNGEEICPVNLISGGSGASILSLMEENNLDIGLVGIAPAVGAVGFDAPVKVVMPMQNGGSAIVLPYDSPVTDWEGMIRYAQERAAAGRPFVMAVPSQGSIQDVIIQSALESAGMHPVRKR